MELRLALTPSCDRGAIEHLVDDSVLCAVVAQIEPLRLDVFVTGDAIGFLPRRRRFTHAGLTDQDEAASSRYCREGNRVGIVGNARTIPRVQQIAASL